MRSKIVSTGGYLPEKVVTNHDLEKLVDTTDEWIFQRSGIRERRIAADDQATSDLAIVAARQCLERSGYVADDIDGVIVATTTPDTTFPSVAVKVQTALGVPACVAFDVQAVCSGFVYALSVADNFIKGGQAKRILVIGAEKMSSVLDWSDRTTCVLFGDGAGAVLLEANDADDAGVLSTHLYADGQYEDLLYTSGGVSKTGDSGYIVMNGREIFKHAVNLMSAAVNDALTANNITPDQVDWLVPHQANSRIIESMARKLSLPMEQVVMTVETHGNTSAASIPLAFDHAVSSGSIKRGDVVLFEALGAGLTWGSALVRF